MFFGEGPAGSQPFGTGQLDGALHRFRPGGEQEDLFLSGSGRRPASRSTGKARSDVARKAVAGQQAGRCLSGDGINDWLPSMSGVGDQHSRRPIDPAVAVSVVDLKTFGLVPHYGRLATHCERFVALQPFENRKRFGNREGGRNTS